MRLAQKTVVLCVTGSIAAYKAALLARLLVKAKAKVIPVMTHAAAKFVGPATFAGITGERVRMEMWEDTERLGGEVHVDLARRADVVAIVPATADFLARMAHGRADDIVAAIALCARCPIVVAPAMHPAMWDHPATQANVRAIQSHGRAKLLGPATGEVASGEQGAGRMVEPEEIAAAIAAALEAHDLDGTNITVSAGPTLEDLDPVRYVGNRSSGKMGFAIAERAAARGAHVTLVAGPVSLEAPTNVTRVDVRSAAEMQKAIASARSDAIIMCAAVADYRPEAQSKAKIKKSGKKMAIALVQNPDIIGELGKKRKGKKPVLVAFALETGTDAHVQSEAKRKLREKKVDFVVANQAKDAFGGDRNRVSFVDARGVDGPHDGDKAAIADLILDRVARLTQKR